MPPRVLFRQDQLAFTGFPFRISHSNVHWIFRFRALGIGVMHMGCGWVHGDRTCPKSHGDLRKVYCDERVIENHGKLQLAYLLLPGKWLNGMTYIGATPALHLGAGGAGCDPYQCIAGYLQDLVVSSLRECPQRDHCWFRGWLCVVCVASLVCLGCLESHLSFVFEERTTPYPEVLFDLK